MSLNTTFCQKSYHCFVITAVITQNCSCVFDFTFLMSSSVWISGESPPCTHRNCWFIRAARGRQSNASMQESYTCSEYLILPAGWGSRQTFQDLKQRKRLSVFWHALNWTLLQMHSRSLSLGDWCTQNKQAFTWTEVSNLKASDRISLKTRLLTRCGNGTYI